MSINRVSISGNLGQDAELRQTQSGMAVLGFSVCVNDRRKNQRTGEWEDRPNWVDCTMFGNRAQGIAPYLSKGCKVAVDGRLSQSTWEKDGQRRSKLEVIVDEIEFMSAQGPSAAQPAACPAAYPAQPATAPQAAPQPAYGYPQQPAYGYPQGAYGQPAQTQVYDEDIPF